MAVSRVLIASLSVSLLLLHMVVADTMLISSEAPSPLPPSPSPSPSPGPSTIDCGAACGARCQLSSRPRLCKRACGTCCARCNCVPPGTSGNVEVCPCYANMTTHGNKRKCP